MVVFAECRHAPGYCGRIYWLLASKISTLQRYCVIAYCLLFSRAAHSLAHVQELEWREKQYDRKVYAPIYDADGSIIVDRVLTYVGSSDSESNVNWGGEATAGELAEIIAHAHGPSGPNCEYLYNLADGLRALGVDDPHVFELDALVRQLRGDEAHHEALPSPPAPPPATQAGGKASCSNLPTQ